jgi:hypothetical protein
VSRHRHGHWRDLPARGRRLTLCRTKRRFWAAFLRDHPSRQRLVAEDHFRKSISSVVLRAWAPCPGQDRDRWYGCPTLRGRDHVRLSADQGRRAAVSTTKPVQAPAGSGQPGTSKKGQPESIPQTLESNCQLPISDVAWEADTRDQPLSGQRPGGHPREPKPCSSSAWSSSSSSSRRSCYAAATASSRRSYCAAAASRQNALTRRAQDTGPAPAARAAKRPATLHCPCS